MKYCKIFETHADYQAYKNSQDFILPNVSHCIDQNDVHYQKEDVMKLSLIASKSYIANNPTFIVQSNYKWAYQAGLTLMGMIRTHEFYQTSDDGILNYALNYYHGLIDANGIYKIPIYDMRVNKTDYSLDDIQPGYNLFYLHEIDNNTNYKTYYNNAIEFLKSQLNDQPRLNAGTVHPYYHKASYPHQAWLDGIFMCEPFRVLYAKTKLSGSQQTAEFDDVVDQILEVSTLTYDSIKKVYRHAFAEQGSNVGWIDPDTNGQSYFAWGRALGWYLMGIVEV